MNADDGLSLDELGMLEGTDKSSLNHDYLRHYERAFSHLRSTCINVLELGVQGGQSLRMLARFFPNATIVGLDMNPQCKRHEADRIRVFIGSQDDERLLGEICATYPPTIVIDDASHQGGPTLASLDAVFPAVLPGGLYIVEDLFFHVGSNAEQWRSNAAEPVAGYFHGLTERLLGTRQLTPPAWLAASGIGPHVDWMCIVNSAIILRKKEAAASVANRIAKAEALLGTNAPARAWEVLCESIWRQQGPTDRAEAAIRKAIQIAPDVDRFHRRLSIILESRRDQIGAIEAARIAVGLANSPENRQRLEHLLAH
jgi:hypothetical protein